MKSTLHLKVINPKGMHLSPSQYLAYGINVINKDPDISVKVSCTGTLDSELVHNIIDLSKEKIIPLNFAGYEIGSIFDIELEGKNVRNALLELKGGYIDWLYLEQLFVY